MSTLKAKIINGVEYEDFLIGSDPELRFEGIKARTVVPFVGDFGADGPDSKIGELRPEANFCPISHVSNIELIMRNGYKKYQKLQNRAWLAGSIQEGNPLGGHIHFGSNCDVNLEEKLTALDKLLAPVVLMIEDPITSKERRSGEYGKLATHMGTINEKYRGFKTKHNSKKPLTHDGFEYRPLPSWLVSKSIANSILALGKVIMFQAHNKKLNKHLWTQLKFINTNTRFYDKYYECDKKFFAPIIPTIYRIVSSFKLFPTYRKYIDLTFSLINQNRGWEDKRDLKKRWSIIPEIKQSKKPSKLFTFQDIYEGNVSDIVKSPAKQGKIFFLGEE